MFQSLRAKQLLDTNKRNALRFWKFQQMSRSNNLTTILPEIQSPISSIRVPVRSQCIPQLGNVVLMDDINRTTAPNSQVVSVKITDPKPEKTQKGGASEGIAIIM